MKLRLALVLVLVSGVALAQYVVNGNPTSGGLPVVGRTPQGKGQQIQVTDAGIVGVNASAQKSVTYFELCAIDTDGGFSTYTIPAGTRAVMVENNGPNSCRVVFAGADGGPAPVIGVLGARLAGMTSSETATAERTTANCNDTACVQVNAICRGAAQHSGLDGGSGCLQVVTAQ